MSDPNGEYEGWVRFLAESAEKLEIVARDEAARDVDVVVCRLITDPLVFPDNLVGHCSQCFRLVQFRPHAPREPKRVCDECARPMIEKQRKSGDEVRFSITEDTARDLADFVRKGKLS